MDGTSLPEVCLGWHQIQEPLSRLTGLEFALYNADAKPVGMVSGESPFCRSIRRGGRDDGFCESQCGKYIKEAARGDKTVNFRCASGQEVFFIPVRHGDTKLVISAGKSFAGREEYKKALKAIKSSGGKVSLTGRHRYRYIGKRRLAEVIALVKNTADQYFQTSHQKNSYQIRNSRQAALLESAGLLHGENTLSDIAGSLLRSVTALFETGTASLLFFNDQTTEAHYIAGENKEAVRAAGEALEEGIREVLSGFRAEYAVIRNNERIISFGLPLDMAPVLVIPFRQSGKLNGTLCLYNAEIKTEDVPALKSFILQSAAIMENRELKERLGERVEKLRSLMDLGVRMGEIREKDELMEFIFQQSAELLQAERGSLMLMNEKTEELIIKLSRGLSAEMENVKIKPGQGIAGKVARDGAPLMVEDLEALSLSKRPNYRTKSFISLPLKADGRVIGVINLADKFSGSAFSKEDLELITGFLSQASLALEKAGISVSLEELRKKSIYDEQTGLLNAEYFNQRLFEEWDRARRYKRSFSLLVMDIKCSDDEELLSAAEAVKRIIRNNDVAGRTGTGEFSFILPETAREGALLLAERIRNEMSCEIKFGAAGYPEDAESTEELLKTAKITLK